MPNDDDRALAEAAVMLVTAKARMITRDGREVECDASFNDEEWQLLGAFVEEVQVLRQTRLTLTPGGLEFSFESIPGHDMQLNPTSVPADDDVRALLMVLRPFLLVSEPTHFGRIKNLLGRELHAHPDFQRFLTRRHQIFHGRRWQEVIRIYSNGVLVNSEEALDLWLNSYQYHRDPDRRAQITAAMPVPMFVPIFIGLLLEKVRAILELGSLVHAMREAAVAVPLPGDDDL